MRIRDLEKISSDLINLCNEAKKEKDIVSKNIEFEKTAFNRFVKYIDSSIAMARKNINKTDGVEVLEKLNFTRGLISNFIEFDLEEEREKIRF